MKGMLDKIQEASSKARTLSAFIQPEENHFSLSFSANYERKSKIQKNRDNPSFTYLFMNLQFKPVQYERIQFN